MFVKYKLRSTVDSANKSMVVIATDFHAIPADIHSGVFTYFQQPICLWPFAFALATTFMPNEERDEIRRCLAQDASSDLAEYLQEKDDIVRFWMATT